MSYAAQVVAKSPLDTMEKAQAYVNELMEG